jgi:hypothetical protein
VPQVIVVIEILIAKRDPKYALTDEGCDRVFGQFRAPHIVKAGRKSINQPNCTIR